MIKPESNAPSPMQPWVRTTDNQLIELESKIARLESLVNGNSSVDHQQNLALSDTFTFTELTDGSVVTSASGMKFSGPIEAQAGLQADSILSVGNPERQLIDPETGSAMGAIPNFEVIAGQFGNNPITGLEYYTDGKINITDATLNLDAYGQINGDGLSISLNNNGNVERQNIAILGVVGSGTTATYQIENNASNIAVYTAGRYVTITGIDPAGYNNTNQIILSVDTGVSPMTFTLEEVETATYNGGGYVTISQPNSVFEGKLSVQGASPDYLGITVNQDGVFAGSDGGNPLTASAYLTPSALKVPEVAGDYLKVNGTKVSVGVTAPPTPADGDMWIDPSSTMAVDPSQVTGLTTGWSTYTPTIGGISTHNGTTAAYYKQIGKTVHLRIRLTFGSTTAVSGGVTFSQPVAASAGAGFGSGWIATGSGVFVASTGAAVNTLTVYATNTAGTYASITNLSSSVPSSWAVGNYISISFTYEAA